MQRIASLMVLTVRELVRRRVRSSSWPLRNGLGAPVAAPGAALRRAVGAHHHRRGTRQRHNLGESILLAAILGATVLAADIERRSIYLIPLLATPVSRVDHRRDRSFPWAHCGSLVQHGLHCSRSTVHAPRGADPRRVLACTKLGSVSASRPPVSPRSRWCSRVSRPALRRGSSRSSFVAVSHLHLESRFLRQSVRCPGDPGRLGHGIALLIPNLEQFDFKGAASDGLVISANAIRLSVLSALSYCTFFVWLAGLIFSRRDLK